MRFSIFAGAFALACNVASAAQAEVHNHQSSKPDDHAPIGVMGDHPHKKGEWMVSYKYEQNHGSGFRNGNDSVSQQSVLMAYGEGATKMDMGMHMVDIMYGISDDLTLMVMPQYMTMDMTHKSMHGGGHSHEHEVSGWGDTEVTGLFSVYKAGGDDRHSRAHIHAGLSLPTGSTDETFVDHHRNLYPMPYNMQLGTGTYDPIIGITYVNEMPKWSWGAQSLNYIRLGKNDEGYRQGNKYTATTWIARNITEAASLSLRLKGEAWGNVSGQNARLPLTAIAGADPDEQAGERVLALVGVNFLTGKEVGMLAGHRIAAEYGLPLYERYSGPQTETGHRFTVGWQYAF